MMYVEEKAAAEITAFRRVEKKYQQHFDQEPKIRNGKIVGYKLIERPTDFSGVIDVDQPESLLAAGDTLLEHKNLPDIPVGCRVFTFPERPGLVFFRKCLAPDLQRRLTIQCLTQFPSPPAHTNFNRSLGRSLPSGLWEASQAGLRLAPVPATENSTEQPPQEPWVNDSAGTPATTLLRKLRWSSIGLIYDWTRRIYVSEWGFMPLPEELSLLAKHLVHLASLTTTSTTAMLDRKNPIFTPDAALINYYHEGDTLNGHIDDAEPDMTQPLVSLSIGRPGVFLIGGFTRDIEPFPVLLRSGDAVILDGDSRKSYHGVPRILPLKIKADNGKKEEGNSGGDVGEQKLKNQEEENRRRGKVHQRELLEPECEFIDWGNHNDADFSPFEQHMNGSRINVSIRSVGGGTC